MIEIFKYDEKWRIKIVNETFEFKNLEDLSKTINQLLALKELKEPYKGGRK